MGHRDDIVVGWPTKAGVVALAVVHALLQGLLSLADVVWEFEGLTLQRGVAVAGSVAIFAFAAVTVAGVVSRHHHNMVRWCTAIAWGGLVVLFVGALQQTPYEWQAMTGPHGRGAHGPELVLRQGVQAGVHLFIALAAWGTGLAAIQRRSSRWHLGWLSAVVLFAGMVAWWPAQPPIP